MNTENKQIQFVFSNGKILKVERGLFLEIFSKIEKIHIYKGDLINFSSGKNFATEELFFILTNILNKQE